VNIAEALRNSARREPGRPAIVFEGSAISYADLDQQVDRAAAALRSLGVTSGDRVALVLPNVPSFAIGYFATLRLGAIAVSMSVALTARELAILIEDSDPVVALTVDELLPTILAATPADRVVTWDTNEKGVRSLADMGVAAPTDVPDVELDRDSPAAILYTSGTTGRQKGAVLTHGNVVFNSAATAGALSIVPEDRLMLFLPLFHCFGQNFILNTAISVGASVVLHRRFDPDRVLASIRQDGVTMFFGVPTVYIVMLARQVAPHDLAGVRYWFSAAATMPTEVAERWREIYGQPIHEGYGLTETSPFASYNHRSEYRPGSVGTALDDVEVGVVDTDDRAVATGTWGEVVIAGPNVMAGYWNRPEDSATALRNGRFHTGDIGYLDEDGYLYLVDRVKDMINAAGLKIWPREIEEILYAHPLVRECAVVGLPDPVRGEAPCAFVVASSNTTIDPDRLVGELEQRCREQLATYKHPRSWAVVAELPKSPTGKILKRVLRDEWASRTPVSTALQTPTPTHDRTSP
jgi:long-chain acyl-CoA synthetase